MVGIQDLSDEQLLGLAPPSTGITALSDEQLMGLVPQEPGFLSRVGERFEERGEIFGDILLAEQADEQTIGETAFQLGGNVIGGLGDVLGEGIVSAAKSLPEEIKEPIADTVASVLDTTIGKAGISALSSGVEAYERFSQKNPRAARDINALFNVGAFFTPIKGVSAAGVTGRGIKATGKGVQKALTKAPVITSDDIATLSAQAYQRAEDLGGTLKPEFADRFVASVEKLQPQTKEGLLLGRETPFTKVVERIQGLRGQPISLRGAQEIDETLSEFIDAALDAGRPTKQSRKLLDIQTTFRENIQKASSGMISGGKQGFDALKDARKLWAGSRRLADIESILARAELTTNPATSIKAGFRALVSNPRRLRGFSKKEISLMRKTAKTGIVGDTFRVILGSRLIPIVTTASGGGLGATAAATAGSIAARGIAEKAVTGRAAAVSGEIARRTLGGVR